MATGKTYPVPTGDKHPLPLALNACSRPKCCRTNPRNPRRKPEMQSGACCSVVTDTTEEEPK